MPQRTEQPVALRKMKKPRPRRKTTSELEERTAVYKFLGARLRYLRESEAKMTLIDLAARLGVSYQQVQKYESGSNKISIDTLLQFARLIGRDLSYVLEGISSIAISVEPISGEPDTTRNREKLKLAKMISQITDKDLQDAIMRFVETLVKE